MSSTDDWMPGFPIRLHFGLRLRIPAAGFGRKEIIRNSVPLLTPHRFAWLGVVLSQTGEGKIRRSFFNTPLGRFVWFEVLSQVGIGGLGLIYDGGCAGDEAPRHDDKCRVRDHAEMWPYAEPLDLPMTEQRFEAFDLAEIAARLDRIDG